MKLFQRLIVAPAALGLLSPLASNASEVNLQDISNYSDVESIDLVNTFNNNKQEKADILLAGGEGLSNSLDSDSFSETTTASFSADFAIGSKSGTDGEEAITAGYSFQIDLNTSFTGEDSLDVSIDAGNATDGTVDEFGLNQTTGNALQVDGIAYTFPVGDKTTVFVGDEMDGSTLYSTACVYGGPSDTLDDCGNATSALGVGGGTAAGVSYDFGGGFTGALGYTGAGASVGGLMTKESSDAYGGQITYTGDSYGVSVTYALSDTTTTDTESYALNAYWTPSEAGSVPSISAGYERKDPDDVFSLSTEQWFVGLQWDEVGPGTFGAAMGTNGAIEESKEAYLMYEAFYSYAMNDGMTITPLIYTKEKAGEDETGVMVKTSFSF